MCELFFDFPIHGAALCTADPLLPPEPLCFFLVFPVFFHCFFKVSGKGVWKWGVSGNGGASGKPRFSGRLLR